MRDYFLWEISKKLGVSPFRTVPQLKTYLIQKYNYAPSLGKLSQLESIASFFGVPEAKMKVKFSEPLKTKKNRPDVRRKISIDEIKRLKREGEKISEIAKIAGVSRQRIFTICQGV